MESDKSQKHNGEIDLIETAKLLWNKRKNILTITSIFTFIGILYALLATPWYSATVKILPSDNEQNSGLLSQYAGLASIAGINIPIISASHFDLYPEIINSNFILDRILKHKFSTTKSDTPITLFEFWELEIDSSEFDWQHILHEEAKENLRNDYIDAHIDKDNRLQTISIYVPDDPLLAAELANFIAFNLDEYNKYYRTYKTSDQIKYIKKSIQNSEAELKKVEIKMMNFLDKNKNYSSPEKKLAFERIQTEYDVQKTIYMELRKQKELTEIEKIKETETLNILEKAVTPIKKYKPKKIIIILSLFFIGLILASFYVIFIDVVKKL